jgi:hypothetical protein
MPLSGHLEVLSSKHSVLERKLEEALNSPSVSDSELAWLKREKLKIKDQIHRLSPGETEH